MKLQIIILFISVTLFSCYIELPETQMDKNLIKSLGIVGTDDLSEFIAEKTYSEIQYELDLSNNISSLSRSRFPDAWMFHGINIYLDKSGNNLYQEYANVIDKKYIVIFINNICMLKIFNNTENDYDDGFLHRFGIFESVDDIYTFLEE